MYTLEKSIQSVFALGDDDLDMVAAAFTPVDLEKGAFFLKKGRMCDRMAYIRSGLLRLYDEQQGKEITQWISEPGYFITDIAAFSFQVPARWHIQALTDCELYVINADKYNRLGEHIPDWGRANRLFLSKCFAMMEERIFGFISLSAEERYHKFFNEHRELIQQVPLQYVASMLGMTPETLSRIRKTMVK